jgi:type VI protein secretion system component VasK
MMLAYDYPLLDVFWTMLWFALFFIWIWLLVAIFADIFRSHDIGGGAKTLWVVFIIFLPLLGVLFYLIVRGRSMHERQARGAARQEQQFQDYIRDVAPRSTTADQLAKLADLKDRGILSDGEFESEKAKILT